ncbi:MAG: hypothetical protein WC521_05375 [Bdellovibrionales bacterium]
MNDSPDIGSAITVTIKNADSMRGFGALLADTLIDPSVRVSKENLVICAYGVKASGKSTLVDSFVENAISGDPKMKTLIRRGDFGFVAYMRSKDEYPPTGSYRNPFDDSKTASMFLFEHAPPEILNAAHFGIVVSHANSSFPDIKNGPKETKTSDYFSNEKYLDITADALDSFAHASFWDKNIVAEKLAKTAFWLRNIQKIGADLTDSKNNERIVQLLLLSDKPEHKRAYARLKTAIQNNGGDFEKTLSLPRKLINRTKAFFGYQSSTYNSPYIL